MNTEIELLKQEIERLKKNKSDISWKISEKGALSVYGLQRLPVTLYKEQWEKIFDKAEDIKKYMEDNKDRLAKKSD